MIKQTFEFDDELRVNRLGYGTMQLPGHGVWGPVLMKPTRLP